MKQGIIAREFVSMVGENGKLQPRVRDEIVRLLTAQQGKKVVIRISKYRKKRSDGQNRFYYGVVLPMVMAMMIGAGNEVDEVEVHEYLKVVVGKMTKLVHDPDGVETAVTRSSTELDTIDWEIWMNQIRAWGANFGLVIPMPHEETYDEPKKPIAKDSSSMITSNQTDGE